MIKTFLFKQFSFKKFDEPPLDLGAMRNPLSIDLGQFVKSEQFRDSVSKSSIRSSRVSLYLLRIIAISDFLSAFLTAYSNTHFQRIETI